MVRILSDFLVTSSLFSWKDLSRLLGVHHRYDIDVVKATRSFEKLSFWQSILGGIIYGKQCCNDIQNSTLRLMHKWVATTCFPMEVVRPIQVDEL